MADAQPGPSSFRTKLISPALKLFMSQDRRPAPVQLFPAAVSWPFSTCQLCSEAPRLHVCWEGASHAHYSCWQWGGFFWLPWPRGREGEWVPVWFRSHRRGCERKLTAEDQKPSLGLILLPGLLLLPGAFPRQPVAETRGQGRQAASAPATAPDHQGTTAALMPPTL